MPDFVGDSKLRPALSEAQRYAKLYQGLHVIPGFIIGAT